MAIRVIAVGTASRDPLVAAADAYLERVRRHVPIAVIEVAAGRRSAKADARKVRAVEAAAILRRAAGAQLVALDATGRSLASEAFAKKLEGWLNRGELAFAIGGATGLHPEVLAAASFVLGLGPLTLSHRLARLVLCEQLYRACAILHGEPYHK
ncbi:MAG: 23S rRNA (pseudouridine(1915)-N(3))-methyltransferase RlmH [Deltaproteobacteria bacterium]|nr:23S rRNA (pseudouridine(1915)-N(3))-methyltransferase RlmH [Deltaproteobacteria bacterium]